MVVFGDNLLLPLKRDRIFAGLFWKGLLLDLVLVLNGEWEGLFFFWTFLLLDLVRKGFFFLRFGMEKSRDGIEKSGGVEQFMNYQK